MRRLRALIAFWYPGLGRLGAARLAWHAGVLSPWLAAASPQWGWAGAGAWLLAALCLARVMRWGRIGRALHAALLGAAPATMASSLLFSGSMPTLSSALALVRTNGHETVSVLQGAPFVAAGLALVFGLYLGGIALAWATAPRAEGRGAGGVRRWALLAMLPLLAPAPIPAALEHYPLQLPVLGVRMTEFHLAARRAAPAQDLKARQDGRAAQTVVFVIGESSHGGYWQLNGYGQPTTPRLAKRMERGELVNFPRHMSTASATFAAVPALMSPFAQFEVAPGVRRQPSVVAVMRQAGYRTAWFSMQGPETPTAEAENVFFQNSADVLTRGTGLDERLEPRLADWLSRTRGAPSFAVLHTAGSHFPFEGRYPASERHWAVEPGRRYALQQSLPNYLNTLRYTDAVLERLIAQLEREATPSVLVFVSDHGETLMHGTTRDQARVDRNVLHVPFFVWANEAWRREHAKAWATLERASRERPVTSHLDIAPTLTGLLGVDYAGRPASRDLLDARFSAWSRTPALDSDYRTPLQVEPAP